MKILERIEIVLSDGSKTKTKVKRFSRGGTKSEPLDLYLVLGRWITPFENRIRKVFSVTVIGHFGLAYSSALVAFSSLRSPFLDRIQNDSHFSGSPWIIPAQLTIKE